jgi:putative transposase
VKYAAIADWAADKEYSVTFMCAQLGVVRQGYYRWLADGPCQRERTDAELTEQIREIHRDLHGHPGVRRVWAELVVRGVRVARKRVWRLMRAAGLRGRFPRAWKKTTTAGRRPIDAPDLIGQDFTAAAPNTRWCGDISYVQTVDGWVYTATVIDLHSRKVVGYAVADHLRTSLIIEALAAASIHVPGVRGLLRGERRYPLHGTARQLRQCGRRVILRDLQEGDHPRPPVEQPQ